MLRRQNRQKVFKKCTSISPSFELIRDAEVYIDRDEGRLLLLNKVLYRQQGSSTPRSKLPTLCTHGLKLP